MFTESADRPAMDYEAIVVSTTAIGISNDKLHLDVNPCLAAFITVEVANIRFRIDGTAPTTTEGHELAAGQNLTLAHELDVRQFLAIKDDETNAVLRVTLRY